MPKKKVSISEALKLPSIAKVEDTRKNLFRVDLEKDHNYSLDVPAATVAEAREAAAEHMNSMPDSILPETLKKDA